MIVIMADTIVGRNLRYLRKKYYVSKRALSRLVGISIYYLSDMEAERVRPELSGQTLRRICSVFDLDMEKLIHTDLLAQEEEDT